MILLGRRALLAVYKCVGEKFLSRAGLIKRKKYAGCFARANHVCDGPHENLTAANEM